MVADENNIYAGTTTGQIVAVPARNLRRLSAADLLVAEASIATTDGPSGATLDEPDGVLLDQSAVAQHTHRDSKVQSLVFVPLPSKKLARPDEQQVHQYRSLPNISGPLCHFPSRPLYKSLVVSLGRGHVEYSAEECGFEDNSPARLQRGRNEAYQLLVWGHKSPLPLT